MARLVGKSTADVQKSRLEIAQAFATGHDLHVVLKGHRTLVVAPDGRTAINRTGNPGMATGGTGDVLTGVIAAWLAQLLDPEAATRVGVYLHGKAGDLAAAAVGAPALVAGDVLRYLGAAWRAVAARTAMTSVADDALLSRSDAETEAIGADLATRLGPGCARAAVRRAGRRQDGVRARPRRRPRRRPGRREQPDLHAGPGIRAAGCRSITSISTAGAGEVDDLGLDALAADGVLAIEWAERMPRDDAGAIEVRLEHAGEDERRITVTTPAREDTPE